ncbi:hypothetical protein NL676_016000 [Syzygium grande]|nr:hypothetical protein NL676_016000 [Syzygium grande]
MMSRHVGREDSPRPLALEVPLDAAQGSCTGGPRCARPLSGAEAFSFPFVCLGSVESRDVLPGCCFPDPLSSSSRVNEAGQLPSKEQETLPRSFGLDSDRPY